MTNLIVQLRLYCSLIICLITCHAVRSQQKPPTNNPPAQNNQNRDAKHQRLESKIIDDPKYAEFGIYAQTAPQPKSVDPKKTNLPLELSPGMRIALIGNTLLDRSLHFGHIETLIYQRYPKHKLVIRNLSWSADSIDIQPRPDNFADVFQHLHHEKIDLIIAAFGFNESFAGPEGADVFREKLSKFVDRLRTKAFNHESCLLYTSDAADE